MAKSARSGHVVYIEFDGVVIDTDFRSFDPGIDSVETSSTAGLDGLESSHLIRETVAPTGQFLIETTETAILEALEQGNTGNLIWGPEGNAAGKPRWGIEARIKKSNIAFAHDGEQVIDVEWVNTGRTWLYDGRSSTF